MSPRPQWRDPAQPRQPLWPTHRGSITRLPSSRAEAFLPGVLRLPLEARVGLSPRWCPPDPQPYLLGAFSHLQTWRAQVLSYLSPTPSPEAERGQGAQPGAVPPNLPVCAVYKALEEKRPAGVSEGKFFKFLDRCQAPVCRSGLWGQAHGASAPRRVGSDARDPSSSSSSFHLLGGGAQGSLRAGLWGPYALPGVT